MRPFAFAVADYLKPPVVPAIDVAGYHGAIGEIIKILARDDFEVSAVTVAIRDGEDAIIQQRAGRARSE